MSGDAVSRAVGGGRTMEIGGQSYTIRPLTVQQLVDLEHEALSFFKREYLKTFSENLYVLGAEIDKQSVLSSKLDEVARWSLEDVPKKTVFDVSQIPVTDGLKNWAKEFAKSIGMEDDKEEWTDNRVRVMASIALDQGRLKTRTLKGLTGKVPRQIQTRYDQWWVTGCFEGMVAFIYSSIKQSHPEVTRKQISEWSAVDVFGAARMVEDTTSPDLKNG